MTNIARILVITFLAVFAASTVSHAAITAPMSVEMALAGVGAINMPNCEGCQSGGEKNKSSVNCYIVCVTPLATFVDANTALQHRAAITVPAFGSYDFTGHHWPPDPFPPRTLALN